MPQIRERVTIAAPPERVWAAVHEDLDKTPSWAGYVRRAVLLDGDRPGPGRRVRYELNLPGDWSLTLLPKEWDRPRRCAGTFTDGPIAGTWSYTYTERNGRTDLDYEMDLKMGGLLGLAGGLLRSRYEEAVKEGMRLLKTHLEEEA